MADTILIVEDNPETLELLRRIMERDGYKTILANDGEKGLSYAGRYLPDLIILDRLMPKLNGLQLCRKLKEQDSTRHIPIVFLTILDAEQDIIEGLKAGADDYISKPFSPDELSVRVERVLFRSVRSTIEDLLTDTAAAGPQSGCFEILLEKLSRTERTLRRTLQNRLTTLVERCHHWNALSHGTVSISGAGDGDAGSISIAEESESIHVQSVQFSRIQHDYTLLRWLISVMYRLSHEMNGRHNGGIKTPTRLRRMYAESTVVMQKIAAARRVLGKTEQFLLQKSRS